MLKILPYKKGSKSCKELCRLLGVKRVRPEGSRYRPTDQIKILNWGNTNPPHNLTGASFINKPYSVLRASNKKTFFNTVDSSILVPYTDDLVVAHEWLTKGSVVCRHVLSGHSGRGIEIVSAGALPLCSLYTKYIKKKEEYRVHVFMGDVIDVQRKMRKREVPDEEVDWKIRSHKNGFIYGRSNVALPVIALDMAKQCVRECGLDFGAVDIIYNDHKERYYCLEVNTAPGLEGTTLENYVKTLREV